MTRCFPQGKEITERLAVASSHDLDSLVQSSAPVASFGPPAGQPTPPTIVALVQVARGSDPENGRQQRSLPPATVSECLNRGVATNRHPEFSEEFMLSIATDGFLPH